MQREQTTDFLPAERATERELARDMELVGELAPPALIESLPVGFMILNTKRQIVFCNEAFCRQARSGSEEVLGRRPGEALGCVHAHESDSGCGTTRFCRFCGAALAILQSLRGVPGAEECRMVRAGDVGDTALDLQVFTAPLCVGGDDFVQVTVLDISHEKRRHSLERVFFHDVLNSASGLFMYSELMERGEVADPVEAGGLLHKSAARLLDLVQEHKDLAAAERGRLAVRDRDVGSLEILQGLRDEFRDRPEARDRRLVLAPDSEDAPLVTDPTLLGRVLRALIANALEAAPPGGAATVSCARRDGGVEFSVHNEGEMPEAVRRQVCKRSFSTKGRGRGLGLYAARLLGRDYLDGELDFDTGPGGTVFRFWLPLARGLKG
ncbi:sensor histidine kinase [Desulfocurvus sp. DL9XJH121]